MLKAVYWDRTGFCLWMKRLERGRFPWPRAADQARRQIDAQEPRMLLLGIDFWNAHRELKYTEIVKKITFGRASARRGDLHGLD